MTDYTAGMPPALPVEALREALGQAELDVAAALASLFDERTRFEQERGQHEVWLELEGHGGFNWASAGDLLSG